MSTLKELFDQHDRAAEEIERRARDFIALCRSIGKPQIVADADINSVGLVGTDNDRICILYSYYRRGYAEDSVEFPLSLVETATPESLAAHFAEQERLKAESDAASKASNAEALRRSELAVLMALKAKYPETK